MNDMTWVFGETSEFSQQLIKYAKKRSSRVRTFGRGKIDYRDIDTFLKKHYKDSTYDLPTKIIINVKTDFEWEDQQNVKDIAIKYLTPVYTITFLAEVLDFIRKKAEDRKNVTVVYITSSATQHLGKDPHAFWLLKEYIGVRHLQQAQMSACDRDRMQVLGVSPSYMDDPEQENLIEKYAKQVIDIVYNPPKHRRGLYDLSMPHLGWKTLYGSFYEGQLHEDE